MRQPAATMYRSHSKSHTFPSATDVVAISRIYPSQLRTGAENDHGLVPNAACEEEYIWRLGVIMDKAFKVSESHHSYHVKSIYFFTSSLLATEDSEVLINSN